MGRFISTPHARAAHCPIATPSYYLILKTGNKNSVMKANERNNWLAFRIPTPPEAMEVQPVVAGQIRAVWAASLLFVPGGSAVADS